MPRVPLNCYLCVCASVCQGGNYLPFTGGGGLAGTLTGFAPMFLGFIGFEAIPNLSQEARDAPRDVPYAIIATLIFSTLLYITSATILVGVLTCAGRAC